MAGRAHRVAAVATTKTIGGNTYYVYDGVYYQASMVDGGTAYVVARA